MLVDRDKSFGVALRCRRCIWISLSVLVVSLLSLAPYLTSSTERVRLRNALLLIDEKDHDFDSTPDAIPPDFMLERGLTDSVFVEVAGRLGLTGMSSDCDKVSAISRHLLSNPRLVGIPIQSNLLDTYCRILEKGSGVCRDFTRVFMAFGVTAGSPMRGWAFSFDSFGRHNELIRPGETGIAFEAGSIDALAPTVVNLLAPQDRRSALGQAGRRLAATKHTRRTGVADYASMCASMVAQS
jgi:hypothetical protein